MPQFFDKGNRNLETFTKKIAVLSLEELLLVLEILDYNPSEWRIFFNNSKACSASQ